MSDEVWNLTGQNYDSDEPPPEPTTTDVTTTESTTIEPTSTEVINDITTVGGTTTVESTPEEITLDAVAKRRIASKAEQLANLKQHVQEPRTHQLDLRGRLGETVLHRACLHNHGDMIRYLVDTFPHRMSLHLIVAHFQGSMIEATPPILQ